VGGDFIAQAEDLAIWTPVTSAFPKKASGGDIEHLPSLVQADKTGVKMAKSPRESTEVFMIALPALAAD
jgi:hypothetical protein